MLNQMEESMEIYQDEADKLALKISCPKTKLMHIRGRANTGEELRMGLGGEHFENTLEATEETSFHIQKYPVHLQHLSSSSTEQKFVLSRPWLTE